MEIVPSPFSFDVQRRATSFLGIVLLYVLPLVTAIPSIDDVTRWMLSCLTSVISRLDGKRGLG